MLEEFRDKMPVASSWVYFDHAAVAPLPKTSAEAMAAEADDFCRNGSANWPVWRRRVEETRLRAARLINAKSAEIAIVHSTTEGISLVAEGYDWQSGDNVVVPSNEFPSNLFPWLNLESRGVEIRRVRPTDGWKLDPSDIDKACNDRTRIVACSWVDYATGRRNNPTALAEVAHRYGALFFLDMIQGAGAFPLDVEQMGVDFAAADGHKWMMGPEGAGILYVRQQNLDRLRPLGIGWNSVVHAGDFVNTELQLKPTAARYEGGTYNMIGNAGLHASLGVLLETRVEAISKQVLSLGDELCDGLMRKGYRIRSERSAERSSGIISVETGSLSPQQLVADCKSQNVIVSNRSGRLRISPHGWCNSEDVARLLDALPDIE